MRRLEGKVSVITGAGRGLGLAAALAMAREGARIVVADRKADLAEGSAEEIRAAGGEAIAVAMDHTNVDHVNRTVAKAVEAFGGIDILFANAGTGKFHPFLECTKEDWDRIINVNLNGAFYTCQAAARQMARQGRGGKIVITASSAAETECDQLVAYAASKAALVMLMKTMASELGPYRINVNAILPGVIETGMTDPMLQDQANRNMLRSQTPLGRWGMASEVADLVVFLSSSEADYITGAEVRIDGGSTLHGYPRWYALDYRKENQSDWDFALKRYPYQDDD